jgi:predicted TIM-barrel fold metal-dependent hydrolase
MWEPKIFSPEKPNEHFVLKAMRKQAEQYSPEALIEHMNESKIDKAVLLGLDSIDFPMFKGYKEYNNYLASVVDRYQDRFIGFLAIDPRRGQDAIEEVDRCVELGFKGIKIAPLICNFDDPSFYPFYEKVREHKLPILFHSGATESPTYMKHYKPIIYDTVASDFPEITIILAHLGKPWVDEAIRAARKNRNLYLDLSAWDDLYLARPMYLVETIAKAKCFCGLDKIMFGSDWPVQLGGASSFHGVSEHMTFKEWIDVIKNLKTPEILKQLDYPEITEEDKRMILGENAAKILNL